MIAPSYVLAEFRHAHLFHGYNTRSRDLLRPPFAKTTKYQGSFRINGARTYNTLPRIIRQVETLREFKSAILNSNACSTCCLCNLINCLVLMSLFLCCVRAPFKLALLNWMPLDKYWLYKKKTTRRVMKNISNKFHQGALTIIFFGGDFYRHTIETWKG